MKLIIDIPDLIYAKVQNHDLTIGIINSLCGSIIYGKFIPDNSTEKEIIHIIHKLFPQHEWCGFTYIE